jgi:hypothetical protein
MKFGMGDRVAWSHGAAAQHSEGSILRASALPPGTPTGTIVDKANERGTWWDVLIDPEHEDHPAVVGAAATHTDPERLVLTSDELVKIDDDVQGVEEGS